MGKSLYIIKSQNYALISVWKLTSVWLTPNYLVHEDNWALDLRVALVHQRLIYSVRYVRRVIWCKQPH